MFTSILSDLSGGLTIESALLCTVVSLVLGFIIACVYMATGRYSKNFVVTLVLLPALVEVVILMVNGNLGTSVAVMGAFSLVRFRSVPGNSRDISSIFFCMATGLAAGMGYLTFAACMVVLIGIIMFTLSKINFGEGQNKDRLLKIIIPENLDYTEVFDDIFSEFTKSHTLDKVKTTNMGSMFELSYTITMKEGNNDKRFIDAIRCRNGNLTIILGRQQMEGDVI